MNNNANPIIRIVAKVIDWLLVLFVLVLLVHYAVSQTTYSNFINAVVNSVVIFVLGICILLPFLVSFLTSKLGGSFGYLLSGLSVVDKENEHITFWRAFFRNNIARAVSTVFFGFGYYWAFMDKDKRAWHDLASNTWVKSKGGIWALVGIISIIVVSVSIGLILSSVFNYILSQPQVYLGMN